MFKKQIPSSLYHQGFTCHQLENTAIFHECIQQGRLPVSRLREIICVLCDHSFDGAITVTSNQRVWWPWFLVIRRGSGDYNFLILITGDLGKKDVFPFFPHQVIMITSLTQRGGNHDVFHHNNTACHDPDGRAALLGSRRGLKGRHVTHNKAGMYKIKLFNPQAAWLCECIREF